MSLNVQLCLIYFIIKGIFEINKETYQDVNACFEEIGIIQDIENFNSLIINNTQYTIKKRFGGDMKFIEIMYGLLNATSNFPCPWCHCHKNEFGNMSKQWSIELTELGARTLEIAKKNIVNRKPDFGYSKKPILDGIEFKDSVIDTLHLFLRISDNLLKLILLDIFEADGGNPLRPNLVIFLNFLEKDCKMLNASYVVDKTIELRSFNGNELINMFEKSLNLEKLFEFPKIKDICCLWNEFFTIFLSLKKQTYDLISLENHLFQWLFLFIKCYGSKFITPYMHTFVYHIPEFIRLHGNINLFNLQGLEKLNDISTNNYHRSSNKSKTYLNQMIQKRNRQELCLLNLI